MRIEFGLQVVLVDACRHLKFGESSRPPTNPCSNFEVAVAQRSAVFSSTLEYFMDSLLWEMSPPWSASLCCTLQSFIILQCFSDIHELFKHKIRKVRERGIHNYTPK